MSPLAWPFLDSKDQMDDQNTQGNSLGGSTIDTLWTGLGLEVLLTFLSLILIQNNWQKQKSLVNLSTRAKNFGRGWSVELKSANSVCSPWASARPKTGFAVAFFLRPKLQTILNFGFFFLKAEVVDQLKTLSCFLISLSCGLIENGMFFLTAVAQPRLVKLWLR